MTTWQDEARNWLLHDGQKGMHWGRRRYRNYDGTLTPAGRERYGVGAPRDAVSNVASKLSRKERKAQKEIKRKASAKTAERKAKAAAKEAEQAQENLRKEREELEQQKAKMVELKNSSEENAQKRLEVDRAKMNNEELQAAINRLKLEREYDALVNPPKPAKQQVNKKSAMERVMEQMDNIKRINTTVNDVVSLAKEIKKLVKGDDNDAYNKLKRAADLDKLRFDMETRNEKRAQWKREENDRLDKKIADADKKAKDINDAAIAARHEEEEKEKKRRATEPDFWAVHHTGLNFDTSADSLEHYGVKRRSGRYPWGSGKDPYNHGTKAPSENPQHKAEQKEKRFSDGLTNVMERAKSMDLLPFGAVGDVKLAVGDREYTPEIRHRVTEAADLGIRALIKQGHDIGNHSQWDTEYVASLEKDDRNREREWFLCEDQTIGLGMVSDMINRGYTSKQVEDFCKAVEANRSEISNTVYDKSIPVRFSQIAFCVLEGGGADVLSYFAKGCEEVKNKK